MQQKVGRFGSRQLWVVYQAAVGTPRGTTVCPFAWGEFEKAAADIPEQCGCDGSGLGVVAGRARGLFAVGSQWRCGAGPAETVLEYPSLFWFNGVSHQSWNNAALDDAVFGGTAGTVSLGGAIVVHNLSFATTGYTITGGTLTLGGD